jgi:hypothetical protein
MGEGRCRLSVSAFVLTAKTDHRSNRAICPTDFPSLHERRSSSISLGVQGRTMSVRAMPCDSWCYQVR